MIYFSGSWRPPWSTLEAWRRGRRGRRPPTTVSPSWTPIEWCSLLMLELKMVITGLEPSPRFYNFLARTTFVLESLLEAKNPGQDAFLGDFVFNSSNS